MSRLTRLCALFFVGAFVATTPTATAANVQVGSSTIAVPDFVPPNFELAPVVVPRPFLSSEADLPPLPYPFQWEAKYDRYSGDTVVLDCVNSPQRLPSEIIIHCADGTFRIQDIQWTSWTHDSALGNGQKFEVECVPHCFNGRVHRGGVQVKLHDVRQVHGNQTFTHMEINEGGNLRNLRIAPI